jgi:NAD(P)-dependent dehydrogenase (short-subunit alcohol dehydrogenase family)
MLDLDMALDADLGIDSIKRVEILSALQERLPEAPAVKPEHLGTLNTLRQLADFLASGGRQPPVSSPQQGADAPRSPGPALERSTLRAVPLDPQVPRPALSLPVGAEIWLTNDDAQLSEALEHQLRETGLRTHRVPCAALCRLERPALLGGLVVLAPRAEVPDAFLADALRGLRHAAPALRAAGRSGAATLVTVSRLDGAFGLAGLDPWREPVDGGLAGMAKTAAREWPEVHCKALDLSSDLKSLQETASALAEEMALTGPAEVGVTPAGHFALECVAQPLSPAEHADQFTPGDVIVLSGGARGVTAEAAVALAGAFRPTLILLGRSPEPGPEPDWLAPLTGEAEIKRELGVRANGNASLKVIGEQYRQVAAQREIRRTLDLIEAAGARAVYRSADIRDADAVAGVLAAVRRDFGPVRGLVHGAGVLADARIEDKTDEQFDRVYGTKVVGLRNLLRAVDTEKLKALVLFSSSTARFGRAGQVDYAVANEVLNKIAQHQARRLPRCRVVSVNWGPWDGGMVTGGLKQLFEQEGIGLIPAAAGATHLVQELASGDGAVEVVALAPGSAEPVAPPKPAPEPSAAARALPTAFERTLARADYPVLDAHVLDGRPVVPVALILEWLAHGALHHNPGLAFHGCDDFRVLHGVILDGKTPPVVRVGAGKAVKRDGLYVAPVELRGRHDGRDVLHARADVILTTDLPPAPSPAPGPPLDGYPHTLEDVYGSLLFHGPLLHAIEEVEGCGPGGIVARLRTAPPPSAWLAQPLRQKWLADPLVLDGGFQLMVLWTREQRGAASLPCFVHRYRQHQRSFPRGLMLAQIRVTKAGQHSILADVHFLDGEGRLVARLEGCECTIDAGLAGAFARRHAAPALPG